MSPLLRRLCGLDGALPRTLVLAAHPDDDVIGAGARIAALHDVRVVFLTDGAPRDATFRSPHVRGTRPEYAALRHDEALAALRLASVPPPCVHWVGAVDREAYHAMALLAATFAATVAVERPEVILTHPYEGGHPDHDAAAFCAWAARRLLGPQEGPPVIAEMTSYHARDGGFVCGEFLTSTSDEIALSLDERERATKRAMIACHGSQRDVLAPFGVDVERFRIAPGYDFGAPPHEGLLWYEVQRWLEGSVWRAAALRAARELFGE